MIGGTIGTKLVLAPIPAMLDISLPLPHPCVASWSRKIRESYDPLNPCTAAIHIKAFREVIDVIDVIEFGAKEQHA